MYDSQQKGRKITKHRLIGWWVALVLGSLLLVVASVSKNGLSVFLGSIIVVVALLMLIAEHYYHGHIRFSFRFARPKKDAEKQVVQKVSAILKKEKDLKKQEQKLKKEVDSVYKQAAQLDIPKVIAKVETRISEEDLKKFLKMVDTLLAKLPDEEINKFIVSKEYQTYKNVLLKYKIK